jgi:hypothetical protein
MVSEIDWPNEVKSEKDGRRLHRGEFAELSRLTSRCDVCEMRGVISGLHRGPYLDGLNATQCAVHVRVKTIERSKIRLSVASRTTPVETFGDAQVARAGVKRRRICAGRASLPVLPPFGRDSAADGKEQTRRPRQSQYGQPSPTVNQSNFESRTNSRVCPLRNPC